MAAKRGLGRGLDALLGVERGQEETDGEAQLSELSVDLLQRGPFQPRVDMREESMQALAESIRAQGVVQPILVRPVENGRYEIVAGERRWRAARLAGEERVPVVVRRVADRAALAMALIENIQREDLNPLEEANALKRLIDEFSMTHQQAAEAVGRSRAAVSNLLRLLDLVPEVQAHLRERTLEMGHARALLGLEPRLQAEIAQQVIARKMSVRETEERVRQAQFVATATPPKITDDPNIRRLQDDLSERLGARVLLQHSDSGKGKLVIHYNDLDELDGILDHVK